MNLLLKYVTKIASFLLILGAFSCESKKEYTITGEIDKTFKVDSIFIYDDTQKSIASAAVTDGKFVMKGSVDTIKMLYIGNAEAHITFEIILENADYTFKLTPEQIKITGGKIHDEIFGFYEDPEYQRLYKEYEKVSIEQFAGLDLSKDEEAVKKAREALDKAQAPVLDFRDNYTSKVIETSSSTLAKAFALMQNYDWEKYPLEKKMNLLIAYQKELGNHPDITKFLDAIALEEEMMKKGESVANGNPFKEVIGLDEKGNEIKLSEIVAKNKYTILEFWASWCSPCRAEIPNLAKAYKKYKSKGLEIYSFSVDTEQKDWLKALKEEQTTWLNVLSKNGFKDECPMQYGIQGVPASYLIAADGTIVASNQELREFNLDKTLKKFFSKK